MIVDSSALIAIVRREHGHEQLVELLVDEHDTYMSAGTALEASIVVDARRSAADSRRLDAVRRELGIAIAPVTAIHVDIARQAYRDFGKGSGHPAQLNYADCFTYALSSERNEPLLYVGEHFSNTDLRSALEA